MNHSMNSADRMTHLKIVLPGFLCASLVALIGTFVHVSEIDSGITPLVKAGQSTALSGRLTRHSTMSTRKTSLMTPQIIQRLNSHAPHYDAIEILMIAAGIVFIVAIAFVL